MRRAPSGECFACGRPWSQHTSVEWQRGCRRPRGAPVYPNSIPDQVAVGEVLVHNHVSPTRQQGRGGFRFWLQVPTGQLERCECDWAPELTEHYRIKASRPATVAP